MVQKLALSGLGLTQDRKKSALTAAAQQSRAAAGGTGTELRRCLVPVAADQECQYPSVTVSTRAELMLLCIVSAAAMLPFRACLYGVRAAETKATL